MNWPLLYKWLIGITVSIIIGLALGEGMCRLIAA